MFFGHDDKQKKSTDKTSFNIPSDLHQRLLEKSQAMGVDKTLVINKSLEIGLSIIETYPYLLEADSKRLSKNGAAVGNIMRILDNM